MKAKLTMDVDKETEKSIKDLVLGFARGFARSEFEKGIKDEIARLTKKMSTSFTNDYATKLLIKEVLASMVSDQWNTLSKSVRAVIKEVIEQELGARIKALAEDAVRLAVAQKLKDKTVWQASEQDNYVRNVVRSEVRNMLK